MMRYLHICCGRFHLLIQAEGVLEVLDLVDEQENAGNEAHGCRLWRGSSIRVVHLRNLLEEAFEHNPPQAALIYSAENAESPIMLTCDQVIGLVQAEESAFCSLPYFEGELGRYFDKALSVPATGRLLLRFMVAAVQP